MYIEYLMHVSREYMYLTSCMHIIIFSDKAWCSLGSYNPMYKQI